MNKNIHEEVLTLNVKEFTTKQIWADLSAAKLMLLETHNTHQTLQSHNITAMDSKLA